MEDISWKDKVANEELLGRVEKKTRVLAGYHQEQESKLVGTVYAANTK